ncbi:hypothetical protein [Kushneria aurantia]|uniref:Uncharacterized protein n=1 Tax=Kushneria aurantia TaxID=504092 RepID=A0ABV6G0Z8_9GAMM|nr:hypothetical protein [Kushneria aurantia]
MKRILMVGCEWYTHYYPGLLNDDAEVTTLEVDPAKRAFGGNNAALLLERTDDA